jgi:MFS family permease
MIFIFVSVIFATPISKMSDRIGRERLTFAGYLVYSFVYFMFGRFNSIAGLLYDNISSAVPFYFGSVIAALAALSITLLFKRRVPDQKKI